MAGSYSRLDDASETKMRLNPRRDSVESQSKHVAANSRHLPIFYFGLLMMATMFGTLFLLVGKESTKMVQVQTPLTIPRIIHQSWKTSTVPVKFAKWSKTWTDFNPGWVHSLWTDDANRELVKSRVPWFLATYDALPKNINRVDAVRYVYMLVHGGFYADLDMECLKSHEALVSLTGPVFGYLGNNMEHPHNVPNAWMASPPGHAFWTYVLERMMRTLGKEDNVEALSGPVMLYAALREYQQLHPQDNITYLAVGQIYPYNWYDTQGLYGICSASGQEFDPVACQKATHAEDSYTITYWSHTWEGTSGLQSVSKE